MDGRGKAMCDGGHGTRGLGLGNPPPMRLSHMRCCGTAVGWGRVSDGEEPRKPMGGTVLESVAVST